MSYPEKFRESLREFHIPVELIRQINNGYEDLNSSSNKKEKTAYFKRATDILTKNIEPDIVHRLYENNACCKGGIREKASKEFAKKYSTLSVTERIPHISEVLYMGVAKLESDGTFVVHAVNYVVGEKFSCACSNFNKSGFHEKSKNYCYCCAGHFLHHYQIMLGVNLRTVEIISSPLDSDGKAPCVIRFAIKR